MNAKAYDISELEGVFFLKCHKCVGIATLTTSSGAPVIKKPKGLRVGDYKCPLCGGKMGEAAVRKCYTCGAKRAVLVRSDAMRCPACGDRQGFSNIRVTVSDVRVRRYRNGVLTEVEEYEDPD